MLTRAHNPYAPQRLLSNYEIDELKRLAAKKSAIFGGPLPWAMFTSRRYIDLDIEAVLDGDPVVQVRCKECDHFVANCSCNQDTLSDEELDELLADSSTPNLAALYAMAKEK